jgi:hypothetical protein
MLNSAASFALVWCPFARCLLTPRLFRLLPDGFLGIVYLDLYRRPQKFPSAAHFTLRCGRRLPSGQYQVRAVQLLCGYQLGIMTQGVARRRSLRVLTEAGQALLPVTADCSPSLLAACARVSPAPQTPVVALVANMAQHAGLALSEVGGAARSALSRCCRMRRFLPGSCHHPPS